MVKITPLQTRIDPMRCMGNWYVHRSIPTPLDSNVCNGLEQYTWNEAKQRVEVQYTYNSGALDGPLSTVFQHGWVTDKELGTTWGVSPKIGPFFVPFKLPYYILDVDMKEYSYIVCAGTPGPWAYVMTRTPKPPAEDEVKAWLGLLEQAGLDVSRVETVQHTQQ
jgi:lipocalin